MLTHRPRAVLAAPRLRSSDGLALSRSLLPVDREIAPIST